MRADTLLRSLPDLSARHERLRTWQGPSKSPFSSLLRHERHHNDGLAASRGVRQVDPRTNARGVDGVAVDQILPGVVGAQLRQPLPARSGRSVVEPPPAPSLRHRPRKRSSAFADRLPETRRRRLPGRSAASGRCPLPHQTLRHRPPSRRGSGNVAKAVLLARGKPIARSIVLRYGRVGASVEDRDIQVARRQLSNDCILRSGEESRL